MKKWKKQIAFVMIAVVLGSFCIFDTGMIKVQAAELAGQEDQEKQVESQNDSQKVEETVDKIDNHGNEDSITAKTAEEGEDAEAETTNPPAEQKEATNKQNTEADTQEPQITDIRVVTEGNIYAISEMEFEIDYKEEGSGISYINLVYEQTGAYSGNRVTYYINPQEGEGIGTGTLISKQPNNNQLPGRYLLSQIQVGDYAGNTATYYRDANTNIMVNTSNGEDMFLPSTESYEVLISESVGIKIKDCQVEGVTDKDNLSAGDSFEFVVTLQNDTDQDVEINPEWCHINWFGVGTYSDSTAEGESFLLSPGSEQQIVFPVSINEYAIPGERTLDMIWINSWTDNDLPGVWYAVETDGVTFTGHDSENNVIDMRKYQNEFDYTVSQSENQDTIPPVIRKVSVDPQTVKVPGKVSLTVETEREQTDIAYIGGTFVDVNRETNTIEFENENVVYSSESRCSVVEIDIDQTKINGDYQLQSIYIGDENGNQTMYTMKNGQLQEAFGNIDFPKVDTCSFEIIESSADEDFNLPKLVELKLDKNQVKAGTALQGTLQAEDEMGVSNVLLRYAADIDMDGANDAYLDLNCDEMIMGEEGYLCNFMVDPYCIPGNYQLWNVIITDGSVRGNEALYIYSKEDHCFYFNGEQVAAPAGTYYGITVTGQENMMVVDMESGDLEQVVANAKNGEKLALTGMYIGNPSVKGISTEVLNLIKKKNMTLIIPDPERTSEIVIEGASISQEPKSKLQIKIQREDLVEDLSGVEADDLYYPVNIYATDTTVPLTMRIRVDDELFDQCGNNPIRISKVGVDGNAVIMQDNLTVTEDGYLEIAFPNGLQGTGVATQMLETSIEGRNTVTQYYSFLVSSRTQSDDVILGDINGDGQINIFDLTQCMNHIIKKAELTGNSLQAADVSGDGQVNIFDLTRIMNFIIKKSESV